MVWGMDVHRDSWAMANELAGWFCTWKEHNYYIRDKKSDLLDMYRTSNSASMECILFYSSFIKIGHIMCKKMFQQIS